jgi:hypothetical protein
MKTINLDGKSEDVMVRDVRFGAAKKAGLKTQIDYELILDEIATIRTIKVIQYGEDIYNEADFEVALWGAYADIRRKFQRMKKLMKYVVGANLGSYIDCKAVDALRDTGRDFANYGIMLVQLLDKFDKTNKLLNEFDKVDNDKSNP